MIQLSKMLRETWIAEAKRGGPIMLRRCCGHLILQGPKTEVQNYNHVLEVNLPFEKFFIHGVTMETGEFIVLLFDFRNMQNILATAVPRTIPDPHSSADTNGSQNYIVHLEIVLT